MRCTNEPAEADHRAQAKAIRQGTTELAQHGQTRFQGASYSREGQEMNNLLIKPRNLQEALAKMSPVDQALGIAVAYGGTDGEWHKAWVIDQMVRVLCGSPERYAELVKEACSGENGPATFEWDCGIPP